MARALASRGHVVHVVTYHLGLDVPPGPFQVHRIRKIPFYRKTAPGPTYRKLMLLDPLLAAKLRAVLDSEAFDIVHAHHYEGVLVARAARRPHLPIIYDAHTTLESELPFHRLGLPGAVLRRLGRALDRRLPALASYVVAVSESIKARLLELGAVHEHNIRVIPGGVETHLFDHPLPDHDGDRAARPTVTYAGNLAPYQGIDLLLRAFQVVSVRRPGVQLVIASDSPFEPYEKLARSLGIRPSIALVNGAVAQLPAHLASAHVVVNPRVDCAGLPMKLLNYMAAGKPIVSFAGSAAPLQHGETGWIVADGDVAGFARAVDRLLDDEPLARTLGENARRYVHAELSWDQSARACEALYRSLVSPASIRHHGKSRGGGATR